MTQEEKEILERGQANLAKMDLAPEQTKTNAYGIDELLNLVDRLLQKHGVQ